MKNKVLKLSFMLCIFFSLFAICNISKAANGYTIKAYDVKMVVNEDNTFDITETITTDFTQSKHGIYRKIPTKNTVNRVDGTSSKNRAKITNIKVNENEEKIAPSKTAISYYIEGDSTERYLTEEDSGIVITYDRASGAFLPLLKADGWENFDVLKEVQNTDLYLTSMQLDGDQYCSKIVVKGGSRTRTITLIPETGKYTITAGETS